MNNYYYFYGGPCSQWYPSRFTVFGVEYNTAEQFMMAAKASQFPGNQDILEKIMATNRPNEQKALGRKVRNFDAHSWNEVARAVVAVGNHAKFSQNEDLKKFLNTHKHMEFVEASPYDCIWGIGLGMSDPDLNDPSKWQGSNYLGKCIDTAAWYIFNDAPESNEAMAEAYDITRCVFEGAFYDDRD